VLRGVSQRELHLTADEENENMLRTKSGRLSYKPLEGWRGERAVYENQGGMLPIRRTAEIAEIVRVEQVTPVKRPFSRRSASVQPAPRGRRAARTRNVFEDNDDGEEEPWEASTKDGQGVMTGPVKIWDNDIGAISQEEEDDIEQQLAFAEKRIQPRPTPDNPSFLFTKTLTMPFFGSGVIELPPGGFKGQKNSRRFQFVFFVHVGKVAVNVNGTRFVISKGGVFQVPRGMLIVMPDLDCEIVLTISVHRQFL
jgi:centromere protein C